MQRSKHERDGTPVRVGDDVSLGKVERIHDCDDSIGGCAKPRVHSSDSLRFTHVYKVDGVDACVLSEGFDVVPPVSTGTYETMDKQHRLTASRMEIVDASASHFNKCLFVSRLLSVLHHGKKASHKNPHGRSTLQSASRRMRRTEAFANYELGDLDVLRAQNVGRTGQAIETWLLVFRRELRNLARRTQGLVPLRAHLDDAIEGSLSQLSAGAADRHFV
jgi:hypothetical protein